MKKTTNQLVAIILYVAASLLAYYFYTWQIIPIIFLFIIANNLEKLEPESMTEQEWIAFLKNLKEDDKEDQKWSAPYSIPPPPKNRRRDVPGKPVQGPEGKWHAEPDYSGCAEHEHVTLTIDQLPSQNHGVLPEATVDEEMDSIRVMLQEADTYGLQLECILWAMREYKEGYAKTVDNACKAAITEWVK